MRLLLAERLACPRCGPVFPLILMASRTEAGRLLEGEFGCPNCRNRYPVSNGIPDLRPSPAPATDPAAPEPPQGPEGSRPSDPEAAVQLAALLGVTEGPAHLLLLGSLVSLAPPLAKLLAGVDGVEVVAAGRGLAALSEREGWSGFEVGSTLPFQPGGFRGVAMTGAEPADWRAAALTLLGPGSRLVVLAPGEGESEHLRSLGFALLLREGRAVVAARS